MEKRIFLLVVITHVSLMLGCDTVDDRFIIRNTTNRPLFFTTSPYDSIEGGSPYEEYYEISNGDTFWKESDHFIIPNGTKRKMVVSDWEEIMQDNFDDHIYIYLFDADTLKKYSWDEIKKRGKYYKKYDFNTSELKERKWEILVD